MESYRFSLFLFILFQHFPHFTRLVFESAFLQSSKASSKSAKASWSAASWDEKLRKWIGVNLGGFSDFIKKLQSGAPKISKLVYNSNNYGLWYL